MRAQTRTDWLATVSATARNFGNRQLLMFAEVFALPRDPEPEVFRANRMTWGLGAAMAAFVGVWATLSDFRINAAKAGGLILFLTLLVVACHFVRCRLRLQTPPALIEAFAQISFISLTAALVSYQLGSLHTPWSDPWLAGIDQAIGFEWNAVNWFVAARPWLADLLRTAYKSFVWQPVTVIVLLGFRMSHKRLQLFMLAWTIALMITLAGLAIAPAQTAYVYFGAAGGHLPDLSAQVGNAQFEALAALRAGGMRSLLDQDLEGLVAFPSFHTTGAVLFAWALWPIRWLRWPAVALNSLMIGSVPVIGAHYLVDAFAGALVALLVLYAAHRFFGLGGHGTPYRRRPGTDATGTPRSRGCER